MRMFIICPVPLLKSKARTRLPTFGASLLLGADDIPLCQLGNHKADNPALYIRHGSGIGRSARRTPDHFAAVSGCGDVNGADRDRLRVNVSGMIYFAVIRPVSVPVRAVIGSVRTFCSVVVYP